MSEITPSPALSPKERSASRAATSRLRSLLLGGLALIAVAVIIALYDRTRPVPPPPRPDVPSGVSNSFAATPAPLFSLNPAPAPSIGASSGQDLLPLFPGASASPLPNAANPAAAIAQMQAQLRRDPRNVQTRIQLAAILDSQGAAGNAEDVLRAALQQGQRQPELFHALGMLYLRNNQFKPAEEAFHIEAKMKPKDFDAHLKLAQAYSYQGRALEATHEFEQAQKIDPANPETYMGLAFLNNSSERYQYAVQYLNEYIKRASQPGPGYALLSRVYLNMRLFEKSIEAGEKAAAAMPNNATVWYNLGEAYVYRVGNRQFLDQAARAFERAIQLSPDNGHAHFELGSVYSRQKRTPEAIAQFREAVRCEPSVGKYHYQLGQLLLRTGQTEEGKQIIAKAQPLIAQNQRESQLLDQISVSPKAIKEMFELGQIYRQQGKYAQAQIWFRTVLERSPRYPQARELLEESQRLAGRSPSP